MAALEKAKQKTIAFMQLQECFGHDSEQGFV
jgi:hypothetical protein